MGKHGIGARWYLVQSLVTYVVVTDYYFKLPEATMNAIATLDPPPTLAQPMKEEPLYEIVDGQQVVVPPMSVYTTWIATKLDHRLGPFAEAHGLGTVVVECLFTLDSVRNQRRRPDVAFVSSATWPLERPIPEAGDWEIVPDLAIEVVSPTEYFDEVYKKLEDYFSFGIRQVWIVAQVNQKIHVYDSPTALRLFSAADEVDCAPLLPGLRFPVSSIFQRQTTPPSATR